MVLTCSRSSSAMLRKTSNRLLRAPRQTDHPGIQGEQRSSLGAQQAVWTRAEPGQAMPAGGPAGSDAKTNTASETVVVGN